MSSVGKIVYNFFVRRNYVFLATVFTSAFAIEMAYDTVSDSIWDNINKGRQWKDIRARYVKEAEESDE